MTCKLHYNDVCAVRFELPILRRIKKREGEI
jgi:hypothetical protein